MPGPLSREQARTLPGRPAQIPVAFGVVTVGPFKVALKITSLLLAIAGEPTPVVTGPIRCNSCLTPSRAGVPASATRLKSPGVPDQMPNNGFESGDPTGVD